MNKHVVIAINKLNSSVAMSLRKMKDEHPSISVVVLRDIGVKPQDRSHIELDELPVSEVETDFFDEARLSADLTPFRHVLLGVVSRSESSIQYLAKLSDMCRDWGLVLPTRESLEIATDKQRMRQRFMHHASEITPAFVRVLDDSDATMQRIAQAVGYPLIIKPANLASSLLVQKCDTPEQAQRAISGALKAIAKLYSESGRYEEPVLIVEQMLEGDLYSVDAYVAGDGEVSYCPAVEYVTGQSIGIDDFFLYRRSVPTLLSGTDWDACKQTVKQGIRAIGLVATTAHAELCKTKDGWKIIEIGPRVGRYRIEMYREAYGIEHSDNDVKVRLGMTPEVSEPAKAFCSAYSIYPPQEGVLQKIDNFESIGELKSAVYVRRFAEDGLYVRHAKNGGHALVEVILAHQHRTQFEQDCAWFENNVKAVVI